MTAPALQESQTVPSLAELREALQQDGLRIRGGNLYRRLQEDERRERAADQLLSLARAALPALLDVAEAAEAVARGGEALPLVKALAKVRP